MDPKRHLLIGAAVAGGLVFLFGPGAFRWLELKQQRQQLKAEIAALERENLRLYEESRRLREDSAYAEAVARRELGFVRPGETKVRFRDTKQASSQQR